MNQQSRKGYRILVLWAIVLSLRMHKASKQEVRNCFSFIKNMLKIQCLQNFHVDITVAKTVVIDKSHFLFHKNQLISNLKQKIECEKLSFNAGMWHWYCCVILG